MTWLLTGVLLWSGAHLFKRLFPEARASLGAAGRPLMALLLVASVVLMVMGYGQIDPVIWWGRQAFWVGVSNVLVYLGFYCVAGSLVGARVSGIVRHPQLTSAMLWAVAHLLVNGDLASAVLFGGVLFWAVAEVVVIDRQEGKPALVKPSQSLGREGLAIAITLGLYGAVAYVHGLLGYPVHG